MLVTESETESRIVEADVVEEDGLQSQLMLVEISGGTRPGTELFPAELLPVLMERL